MKKYALGISALALAIAFSAFTTHKPFASKTFFYKAGTVDQRLESGFTTTGLQHSITSTNYTNVNNWTETDQSADTYAGVDGSSYVKAITITNFDPSMLGDGGSDGDLTLQEALTAIFSYVNSHSSTYPSATLTVDGSATITDFTRAEHANP